MKKMLVWVFVGAMVLLFSSCGTAFAPLETDKVEKITLWTQEAEVELAAEDIQTVVDLYNTSVYGGKATGEGGTPDWGLYIHLKNGDTMCVNQFFGEFEVFIEDKAGFYLENEAFYTHLSTLAETLLPSAA